MKNTIKIKLIWGGFGVVCSILLFLYLGKQSDLCFKYEEMDYIIAIDEKDGSFVFVARSPLAMKIMEGDYSGFVREYKKEKDLSKVDRILLIMAFEQNRKSYNNIKIFDFMLEKGVDINVIYPEMEHTFLEMAISRFDLVAIRLLVEHGADPFEILINNKGSILYGLLRENSKEILPSNSSSEIFFEKASNKNKSGYCSRSFQNSVNRTREYLKDILGKDIWEKLKKAITTQEECSDNLRKTKGLSDDEYKKREDNIKEKYIDTIKGIKDEYLKHKTNNVIDKK